MPRCEPPGASRTAGDGLTSHWELKRLIEVYGIDAVIDALRAIARDHRERLQFWGTLENALDNVI
jgi:hypothetical protein